MVSLPKSFEGLSLRRILFRNTGIQLISQAVSVGVGVVTTFVLARYFGVAGFGGLNYVFAFYYFFLTLADLGIGVVVVRECSQRPHEAARIIGTMSSFKFVWALLLMAGAWGLITVAGFTPALRPALYIYALVLPVVSLQLPLAIFQVNLNATYPAILGLSRSLTNGLFLIALVYLGLGMTGYVLSLLISEAIMLGLVLHLSRRFIIPVWKCDFQILKKILKSSLTIALTGIFVAIVNRADFIMLERMVNLDQVGLYSAVYRVTNLLESLPLAMMMTLYPVMSRYARQEDRQRLRSIYKKSLWLFGAIALPMGLTIIVFAEPMVRILFGTKFLEAAGGLRILIWATVCLYLALPSGNLLICLGREKINLSMMILAAVSNITLNLFWIPQYGFRGAASATVVSFLILLTTNTLAARQILKNPVSSESRGPS